MRFAPDSSCAISGSGSCRCWPTGSFGSPGPGSSVPEPGAWAPEEALAAREQGGPGGGASPEGEPAAVGTGPLVDTSPPAHLVRPSSAAGAVAALERLVSESSPASGSASGALVGVAGRWDTDPGRGVLAGVALNVGDHALWLDAQRLAEPATRQALAGLMGSSPVTAHHAKELFRSLLPLGIDCTSLAMDTAVAAYLLDPSTGDYSLEAVARAPVGGEEGAAVLGQLTLGAGLDTDAETVDRVVGASAEAATAARLVPPLRSQLDADGLRSLHDDVERPLVRVLARMEVAGIGVDTAELRRIADELASNVKQLEAEIHQLAGRSFNVNSTPQLRTVLYEELGLRPGRKTKTGYSTDAATLESLIDDHPVVETLLRYREVEKLRSTYGESLIAEVAADGRIHASFRQTVARTGRLSSDRPNLHNIPVRTEGGRQFRRAFVPAPGHRFLVADYDQIELRVIAHLSKDPGLVEAFRTGADVHRAVASGVYRVPADEVTHTQRERAKMVSYGLAYGMEAFGLARRLATGVDEANEIMTRYFDAFPEVRRYMDWTVIEARTRGFTRTELGRKRPLPELSDRNFRVRQAAERQAMNAGIQGLAADLFKTALVRLDSALESERMASRLVLQVHDEVIVEAAPGEEDAVAALTESALIGAAQLSVPLRVSMSWGDSWAAAKGGA